MGSDHDRIDLSAHIDTTVDAAWQLVGEPGWFINTGQLAQHTVEWHGQQRVTVSDPDCGSFTFAVEALDPPRYGAYRGLDADGHGGSRPVEFWLTAQPGGVSVRLVESGFASMHGSTDDQVAQHEQNTKTWKHQLELARQQLEAPPS